MSNLFRDNENDSFDDLVAMFIEKNQKLKMHIEIRQTVVQSKMTMGLINQVDGDMQLIYLDKQLERVKNILNNSAVLRNDEYFLKQSPEVENEIQKDYKNLKEDFYEINQTEEIKWENELMSCFYELSARDLRVLYQGVTLGENRRSMSKELTIKFLVKEAVLDKRFLLKFKNFVNLIDNKKLMICIIEKAEE